LTALVHDFDDLASSCDRNSAKTCRTPADEGGLDIPRSSVVVDPWRWKVCARCADEGARGERAKARGTYVDPASGRQRFDDFADDWAVGQDWKASTRDA
jgi:hypothetical protein